MAEFFVSCTSCHPLFVSYSVPLLWPCMNPTLWSTLPSNAVKSLLIPYTSVPGVQTYLLSSFRYVKIARNGKDVKPQSLLLALTVAAPSYFLDYCGACRAMSSLSMYYARGRQMV